MLDTSEPDALTLDAMALLAPPSARRPVHIGAEPSLSSTGVEPGLPLNLLDQVASLSKHKCIRYVAASLRLERKRHYESVAYDRAVVDRAKLWGLEEDRVRREIEEEMSHCTFHPKVSASAVEMRHQKVSDFFEYGQTWLKAREHRRAKEQKKLAKEAAEEQEEIAAGYYKLSKSSKHVLERKAAEEKERALTPRRSARYSPYVDPCTFKPKTTPYTPPQDAESVTRRLTRCVTPEHVPDTAYGSFPSPRRLVMDEVDIDIMCDRLHHEVRRGQHPAASTPRRRGSTTPRRAGEATEDFPFKPTIHHMTASVRRAMEPVMAPPPPRVDIDDDSICPPLRAVTQDEIDEFFDRNEEWKREVHGRRAELLRQKQQREVDRHPFAPQITRLAEVSGRSWGLTPPPPMPPKPRAPKNHGPKIIPYTPESKAKLQRAPVVGATATASVRAELRQWFQQMDVERRGSIETAVAYEALCELARSNGLEPNPVDVAAEFATRILPVDFTLLYERVVPV